MSGKSLQPKRPESHSDPLCWSYQHSQLKGSQGSNPFLFHTCGPVELPHALTLSATSHPSPLCFDCLDTLYLEKPQNDGWTVIDMKLIEAFPSGQNSNFWREIWEEGSAGEHPWCEICNRAQQDCCHRWPAICSAKTDGKEMTKCH